MGQSGSKTWSTVYFQVEHEHPSLYDKDILIRTFELTDQTLIKILQACHGKTFEIDATKSNILYGEKMLMSNPHEAKFEFIRKLSDPSTDEYKSFAKHICATSSEAQQHMNWFNTYKFKIIQAKWTMMSLSL